MTDNEVLDLIDKHTDLVTELRNVKKKLDSIKIKQRLRVTKLIMSITGEEEYKKMSGKKK